MIEVIKHVAAMPIGEITSWATLVILGFGLFFEISPIKFNPVSMFLGWIGKRLNKSVEEKVNRLEEKVDDLERKTDDNEVYRLRYEVLDFANSCRDGRQHAKEEFDHIFDASDRYEKIIENRDFVNGQIEQAHVFISRLYQNYCDNNSFL